MGLSRALVDDLTSVSDALDDPDVDLSAAVGVLANALGVVVPNFLGLTVMVHVAGHPVVINSVNVVRLRSVHGSLVLTLLPLGVATASGSIAFYSGLPGAFLTLAEDVRWIFNLDGRPVLDGDLPA